MIKNVLIRFLLTGILFNISCFIYSQQTNIGLTATANITDNEKLMPEFGVVFDKQIITHHGFESGLYYKASKYSYFFPNTIKPVFIVEKYISLPLLYKYYTNIVNLSAGLTFDYYTGWYQSSSNSSLKVTSFKSNDKFYYGFTGRVSKSILFGSRFLLEPELKFNISATSYRRHFLGFGIAFKYNLLKAVLTV